MGMVVPGVTHCERCGRCLSPSEIYICNECSEVTKIEMEKEERREENKRKRDIGRMLKWFNSLTSYEFKALNLLIKNLGLHLQQEEKEKELKRIKEKYNVPQDNKLLQNLVFGRNKNTLDDKGKCKRNRIIELPEDIVYNFESDCYIRIPDGDKVSVSQLYKYEKEV